MTIIVPLSQKSVDRKKLSQAITINQPSVSQQSFQPPSFINSINQLRQLNLAISNFHHCYDDLHNHVDSIKHAISSKSQPNTPDFTSLGEKPVDFGGKMSPKQSAMESVLEDLCKTMCGRGLRKYMVSHLSELSKLREEVPKALRLAPNPAKLVLECLGKFYSQGRRAFSRDSPLIAAREVGILILECFLLMMGLNGNGNGNGNDDGLLVIDKYVREEAETAALAWRKRLVAEGGLGRATQADGRGLLLFVACFGIPPSFRKEDIRDLVVTANAKEIAGVLRNSRVMMNKIPVDIISLVDLRVDVSRERLGLSDVKLQTQRNLGTNRSILPEKPQGQRSEGYSSTKKRKSRLHVNQAPIEHDQRVSKHARIDSPPPTSSSKIERGPICKQDSSLPREDDYLVEEGLSLNRSLLEEAILEKDSDFVDFYLLNLIEYMLGKRLDQGSNILQQHLDNEKVKLHKLQDELVRKKELEEEVIHLKSQLQDELDKKKELGKEVVRLKTQLQDSKKENTKLGIKIEGFIDTRDQLLEKHMDDLEHARLEGLNKFLNSEEVIRLKSQLLDELDKKNELAEEVIRLKTQLQDSKKENTKLGIQIKSFIDSRDQLLEQHMDDLEHARLEDLNKSLNSVEWKITLEDARKNHLMIFRDSQEYRDELTQKAAVFYAKGFDVCRQQVCNSQILPLDFDRSFLDVRADEMGRLPVEFEAPSMEVNS